MNVDPDAILVWSWEVGWREPPKETVEETVEDKISMLLSVSDVRVETVVKKIEVFWERSVTLSNG